jgi:hypothetical protein
VSKEDLPVSDRPNRRGFFGAIAAALALPAFVRRVGVPEMSHEIIDEPNRFITSSVMSRALRQLAGQRAGEVSIAADLMREAADEIDRLRDALFWCGGSQSFDEGGEAYEGWQKKCEPLLRPDA